MKSLQKVVSFGLKSGNGNEDQQVNLESSEWICNEYLNGRDWEGKSIREGRRLSPERVIVTVSGKRDGNIARFIG
jgi:hypothetical protein